MTLLAAYYSGRHELEVFAVSIMEALRDDRRLQTEDRIKSLLTQLAGVRGACMTIIRAITPARALTGGECSPALAQQMELYVHVAAPAGRATVAKLRGPFATELLRTSNEVSYALGYRKKA